MGTSNAEKSSEGSNIAEGTAPPNNEEFQWTVDNEVHLFHAMIGNKLAGINKYFHMIAVCEKFSNSLNKEISSDSLWKYLDTLYNFEVLDELEGVLFPNEEKDFSLPESEYGPLMKQKLKEIASVKVEEPEDRSTSPRIPNVSRSSSRGAASKENTPKTVSKKDQNEKQTKSQKESNSSQNVADSGTPIKTSEKEPKLDPRRDSKDSTSSNKEISKTPVNVNKTTKDVKSTKSSRSSVADKLDDSTKLLDDSSAKRGNKRSTRGSMKSEEPTPPSRRRRI